VHKWLQDYAYRVNISWWVFAIAGAVAMFIALVTVSFQAIKAAITNPVKSFKDRMKNVWTSDECPKRHCSLLITDNEKSHVKELSQTAWRNLTKINFIPRSTLQGLLSD
jgi:hypothetical protein